ncbi:radical SAM family heme chaperone HemW [Lentibacillus sediminis]|uniref:radical SAM family heme chaperone HemW n=1 Tax=Lentibacillus sediminis TaxID=1940529 RepID=UPI000C1BA8F3|nr:radical SAM family heme chaperone HemW [Lentibacillus sediminis]
MYQVQAAYIHIPFCRQLCHYCDFVKFYYNEQLATEYLEALGKEIRTALPGSNNPIRTIFIGGGTPTALNREQLITLMETIHHTFDVAGCEEFSIEVNPGDLDAEKASILKSYGVNRISFGVQVMDDHMLKKLGRHHRVSDVYDNIDLLQQQNFTNISLDLIYALPNQTVEHFSQSLDEAMAFELPHYATYALQIEPKTVFYQRHQKGKLHRPPEEDEVAMYGILRDTMKKNGKEQYEISNFAKPGYESRHNLTYWNNDYYYGFGAGAHGYLPGERITNIRPLPAYIKQAMKDGKPVLNIDEIHLKEQMEEEMFLGLRRLRGVDKSSFSDKFGIPFDQLYHAPVKKLIRQGLLQESSNTIQLTDRGLLLANRAMAEFLLENTDLLHVY